VSLELHSVDLKFNLQLRRLLPIVEIHDVSSGKL
jgi:hypothetical protein